MKALRLAALALPLLLAACIGFGDDDDQDRDKDNDRSQAAERAEKYCVDEAKARGWRVENVGRVEKVTKKQYEVKLRVAPKTKQLKGAETESEKVLCRYDDETRDARID